MRNYGICMRTILLDIWTLFRRHLASNHWRFDYLLNSAFRLRVKKISKLRITSPLWWKFSDDRWISLTAWWRNQMEIFSALLALCAGNSPVTGELFSQRPVTRSFDVLFDLCLNLRLNKQSWGWWFEAPSCSLWRYCNGVRVIRKHFYIMKSSYMWEITTHQSTDIVHTFCFLFSGCTQHTVYVRSRETEATRNIDNQYSNYLFVWIIRNWHANVYRHAVVILIYQNQ